MPRSASPDEIAASASSKVAQATGSASGKASTMAIWELAPGSPWNAIFLGVLVVLLMARLVSAAQPFASARRFEVPAVFAASPRQELQIEKRHWNPILFWRPVSEFRTRGAAWVYELRKRG